MCFFFWIVDTTSIASGVAGTGKKSFTNRSRLDFRVAFVLVASSYSEALAFVKQLVTQFVRINKFFIKPDNMKFENGILSQAVKNNKNLCLLSYPLNKFTGRLFVKILKTKAGSDFHMGIM